MNKPSGFKSAQQRREDFCKDMDAKAVAIMLQKQRYDEIERRERYVNGHSVVTVAGVYCQLD